MSTRLIVRVAAIAIMLIAYGTVQLILLAK